jgi:hypothetical protein
MVEELIVDSKDKIDGNIFGFDSAVVNWKNGCVIQSE